MGALINAFDWTASPIGPVDTWPPSLSTLVNVALHSQFPIIIFWGPDLCMLYNDAYLPILADKHPTALGQPAREGWAEVWAIAGPMLEGVLATGQATWAEDLLLPILHDGVTSAHYFTFSYSPICDHQGYVYGVFCPVTETTERVEHARREYALRHAAETARDQVAHILESMSDSFVAFDAQWRITAVNASGAVAMHHRREDLLGKVYWEEFPPTRATNLFTEFQQAMSQRVAVTFESYYPPWQCWYDVHVYPANDGGLAVFFRDITARKHAEEALARHARDLARAHADLRQVAFVSAHDLQEPVRQIGLYTQHLARRYRSSFDAETQEAVDFIVEGTARMQAQFTDLMHYLEIDEPSGSMSMTNCEDLLQRVVDALREPIARSDATLTHDPLPTVVADAKQLQMVFLELLDNAVKFHNSEPPRIHVWAEREEGGWRFAVQDNGIGIETQSRGQLFGFFRKLQRRQDYPGTGMGLAICKKIVERHGGRIWLESTLGEGTTVYFTITENSSQ